MTMPPMQPTLPPEPTTADPMTQALGGSPMNMQPPAPQPWPPQMLYGPGGLPIWWQDDPAAHLAVLNEIILDERKPFPLRKLAADRSTIYEQLAQAKADPLQPVPAEVIGVPLNRLVVPVGGMAPTGSMVPTPSNTPAVTTPDAASSGPPPGVGGMSEGPAPLGTVGADEQGLRK